MNNHARHANADIKLQKKKKGCIFIFLFYVMKMASEDSMLLFENTGIKDIHPILGYSSMKLSKTPNKI